MSVVHLVIDPQWAVPINSGLLILLALVNIWRTRKTNKKVDLLSQQAIDAKNKIGANRREEDKALIEEVKEHSDHFPETIDPNPKRRFTDC